MSGGSPTQWRSGIATSLDSLTLQPESVFNIQHSHNPPDGEADNAAHTGVPALGGSREERAGTSNVGRFNFVSSNQRTVSDLILDRPERFEDTPYVPPRVSQAELPAYPALHPRTTNAYDPPNHNIHQVQYPCEGATSPSESHQSLESNWSTSSSSSASSQQLHDYLEHSSQYSQTPLSLRPTTNPHYPAYYGQHRLGLEHVRGGEHPSNAGGSYYRPPQGYSIGGLLSPEVFDVANTRVAISSRGTLQQSSPSSSAPAINRPSNTSTFSVSPTHLIDGNHTCFQDAGPYLRKQLGLSAQDPISLYSLPDPPPGEKPSAPLPILIKLAIYGNPSKQLTLQEIYTELENRFQWFRDHKHERAWKNSIRHNLSLNKVFRHVPRPITEPGKGSYWQLDVSEGEGYKRLRKRRPKNRAIASEEEDEDPSEMDEDRQSPLDPSQHAGSSRSSATPGEDSYIDPELRGEGHIVGEGRTRSTTRRAGGGSPYPSQSPRIQQGPLPQDTCALGQPPVRSGQPSFGQSSFPSYTQTRSMPTGSSNSSFTTMTSSSVAMAPTTSAVSRPQVQHVASYDRAAPTPHSTPRPGIEYGDPSVTRHGYSESHAQSQGNAACSSPESSSSGSARTWNARSTSRKQDNQ